jgi:hypothetical protein
MSVIRNSACIAFVVLASACTGQRADAPREDRTKLAAAGCYNLSVDSSAESSTRGWLPPPKTLLLESSPARAQALGSLPVDAADAIAIGDSVYPDGWWTQRGDSFHVVFAQSMGSQTLTLDGHAESVGTVRGRIGGEHDQAPPASGTFMGTSVPCDSIVSTRSVPTWTYADSDLVPDASLPSVDARSCQNAPFSSQVIAYAWANSGVPFSSEDFAVTVTIPRSAHPPATIGVGWSGHWWRARVGREHPEQTTDTMMVLRTVHDGPDWLKRVDSVQVCLRLDRQPSRRYVRSPSVVLVHTS